MLSVENVRKSYHLRPILRNVNFQVGEGTSAGIFGRNGAGKTTLLKLIARICSCDGGDVKFNAHSILKGPASNRNGILYLGHQPNLYPILSAEENLKLICRLYGLAISEKELLTALEAVGLSRQRWDPIRYYSRGMLQRLGVAKAMVVPWKLLLMDEPVTGLDEKGIELLERFVRISQEKEKSLIIVSHQLPWLKRFCSPIFNLVDGEVREIQPA